MPLQSPRYTLDRTADGIRAIIPAAKNWFLLLFLSVWLCGWFFGESSAIATLAGHSFSGKVQPVGFLAIWLLFWTAGGVAVVATLLWQFSGREIIALNSTRLTYRIEAFVFGRSRSYPIRDVTDLRASVSPFYRLQRWGRFGLPFGADGAGSVVFDYGGRTIRMAPGLDEAEAKMLVKELSTRLKG
jgi:hypothetical protein